MSQLIIAFYAVTLSAPAGWLLAIFMGHAGYPASRGLRAIAGLIGIGAVGIVCFICGAEVFWVNLLCGLVIAGFLFRCLWEHSLWLHEQTLTKSQPQIVDQPHYTVGADRTV